MLKKIIKFFDRVEDKTRGKLSHLPFLYAFLGGVGVVLFWRGVWHSMDFVTLFILDEAEITLFNLLDGPISLVIGSLLLLITGVFVSAFIGNRLIISGLKGEKTLVEKTEEEIMSEETEIQKIQKTINEVKEKIDKIEKEI